MASVRISSYSRPYFHELELRANGTGTGTGTCTHNANEWSSDAPAELEPTSWVVSNHVLNAVIETVHPETPRNGDALEEDEPKENQIAAGVAVEKLENVHAALK